MIKRLSKIVGFLLSVFGLYQLAKELYVFLGSMTYTLVLSFAVTGIWLFYEFIRYIYNPFVFRFFNAKPITESIITNLKIEIFIDENGQATSHSWRTYIFKSKPKRWELYDTLFVKGEFSKNIEEYYFSNDSKVSSYKRLDRNIILVFWKPIEKEIHPYMPYEHHYVYKPPSNFNDDENFYLLYKICPVGLSRFIMHTYRAIKDVWAIEIEGHEKDMNEEKARSLIESTKEFSIPQPIKTEDGFSWEAYGTEFSKPILFFFRYLDQGSNNTLHTDGNSAAFHCRR